MKIPTKEIKIRKKTVFLFMFIIGFTIISVFMMQLNKGSSPNTEIVLKDIELIQFEQPKEGQDIAVIETSAGTMKAMIFSEECPKAAALFKEAAANGAYTNLPVSQIEKGIMFICNSRNEKGKTIPDEYHKNLWPFKGSICTVSSQLGYGSESIFFIDTAEITDEMKQTFSNSGELQSVSDAFIEHGGIPNFTQQYTVFAQVYDGLDVIDAITDSAYDEETGTPTDEIVIKSVTISTYTKE